MSCNIVCGALGATSTFRDDPGVESPEAKGGCIGFCPASTGGAPTTRGACCGNCGGPGGPLSVPPPEGVPVPDKGGDGGGESLPVWPGKGPVGCCPSLPVTGPEEDPFWVSSPLFDMVASKQGKGHE